MSRIILNETAKRGSVENSRPYFQKQTEYYQKLQEEADMRIKLDMIQRSNAEIAARNYVCT